MRRFALMFVAAVQWLAAAVKSPFQRPGEMPGLDELLERAKVPRSASPELLAVARAAGLTMDGDEEDDEEQEDEEDDDSEGDDEDDDSDEDEDSDGDEEEDEDDEDSDDEVNEDDLDPKVRAVLRKERKARREAEKRAKKAEKTQRRRRGRRSRDDDAGRGKKKSRRERETRERDEEDTDTPDAGTVKLQRANLISALQEEGFTGKRAKAVARLLDDVEFDDDDEPVDIKDRIEEAEETYGKDAVRRSTRKPGPTDGGGGGGDGERPSLTADELKMAKSMGMTPKEYAAYKSPQPDIPDKKKDK